jgi:hypothetical protein
LDFTKLGSIERNYFLRELDKATDIINAPGGYDKMKLDQKSRNNYEEVSLPARSSINPDMGASAVGNKGDSKGNLLPPANEVEEANLIAVVKKIEKHTNMNKFLLDVLKNCDIEDNVLNTEDLNRYLSQK